MVNLMLLRQTTSEPAKRNRNIFPFIFLFLLLMMAACARLPTPTSSLADVAGLACQGKAVPGAASFTDGTEATYHIFIANMDGSSSTWNKHLPQSLSAKGIADLNAVLCIDTQVLDTETFDCGNYKAVNTVETVSLKVGRYLLHTRLVSAGAGETIFDYQAQGQ